MARAEASSVSTQVEISQGRSWLGPRMQGLLQRGAQEGLEIKAIGCPTGRVFDSDMESSLPDGAPASALPRERRVG